MNVGLCLRLPETLMDTLSFGCSQHAVAKTVCWAVKSQRDITSSKLYLFTHAHIMSEIKTSPLQCAINLIVQASLSKYFVLASIKILQ